MWRAPPGQGFNDVVRDSDGVVDRYADLFAAYDTVDWVLERKQNRALRSKLAQQLEFGGFLSRVGDFLQSWFLIWAIGVSVGVLAGVMDILTSWILDLREGHCSSHYYVSKSICCWYAVGPSATCDSWNPWFGSIRNGILRTFAHNGIFILLSITFAVMSAQIVTKYLPSASGSGYTEIKCVLGGFVVRNFLHAKMLFIKSVGICLSLGSGLHIGKEELLVHLSCCIGRGLMSLMPKYATNESKMREILSVCSATAVSVAFGAPVGGVLFVLEELSYYFPYRTMFRSFFCAMIGSISLRMVNPYRTGQSIIFAVGYVRDWLGFELIVFVQLGVFGGIFGAFVTKLSQRWHAIREKHGFNRYPLTEVAIISLITSIIGTFHSLFRSSSARLVALLFQDCIGNDLDGLCTTDGTYISHVLLILASAVIRIILPIVTAASAVPGGMFLPAMAVGGCIGRSVGILMQAVHKRYPTWLIFSECQPGVECITPSTYAIVGAAATLGGVTRSTMSLAVIMFELTGALSYMLPIMVSAIVSRWVHDMFSSNVLLSSQTLQPMPYLYKDVDYCDDADETIVDKMTTKQTLVTISDGIPLKELKDVIQKTDYRIYPVVLPALGNKFFGFVYREHLLSFVHAQESGEHVGQHRVWFTETEHTAMRSGGLVFDQFVDQSPVVVEIKMPMALAVHIFKMTGCHSIAVLDRGVLVGLLTRKDVLVRCTDQVEASGNW